MLIKFKMQWVNCVNWKDNKHSFFSSEQLVVQLKVQSDHLGNFVFIFIISNTS